MPRRCRLLCGHVATAAFLLGYFLASGVGAESESDFTVAVDRAIVAAERSLQAGDRAAAEGHYGEALFKGWLLMGTLERLDGRLPEARRALDEAVKAAPDDPETVFLLAAEYLWLKEVETAERLFAVVVGARPIPQTHVLIGRAYRDAGEYARASAELGAALRQDPGVRRAHYYLGMVALADVGIGPERYEKARVEFLEELKLAPEDPLTIDSSVWCTSRPAAPQRLCLPSRPPSAEKNVGSTSRTSGVASWRSSGLAMPSSPLVGRSSWRSRRGYRTRSSSGSTTSWVSRSGTRERRRRPRLT